MAKSLEQLSEEIQSLLRQEKSLLAYAGRLDRIIQSLKTKRQHILEESIRIRDEKHALSREYQSLKSPCRNILSEAEKVIGRKLTLNEIIIIENHYAKTVKNPNAISH